MKKFWFTSTKGWLVFMIILWLTSVILDHMQRCTIVVNGKSVLHFFNLILRVRSFFADHHIFLSHHHIKFNILCSMHTWVRQVSNYNDFITLPTYMKIFQAFLALASSLLIFHYFRYPLYNFTPLFSES